MIEEKELAELKDGVRRMSTFVDSGRWQDAPWAEGAFTQHFLSLVKDCSLLVDIGAEIGFYSYLALKTMPAGSRIVAFEADPLRHAVLKDLFSSYPQVEVVGLAVDSVTTTRQFVRPSSQEFPCATLAQVDGSVFEVRTTQLDDYELGGPVGMIKMDIEGAEINALLGMRRLLARDRPTIHFEAHPYLIEQIAKGGLRQIEELFSSLNYELFNCDYDDLVPVGRIVGSRLYACHQDAVRETTARSTGLLRRWKNVATVRGWLRLRRVVREATAGY